MTQVKRTELFEKTPIRQAVLKQIFPAILSQMIMLIYNLADTYFVGLLNDPVQTASVTVTHSPFLLLSVFINLFGIGGGSAISRSLGSHDEEKAKSIPAISFYLSIICGLLYSLTFYLTKKWVLYTCGATDSTYQVCADYAMWVIVYGGVFAISNQTLANLIRSEGNARVASIGASFGGILNIILDPFFVLPQFLHLGAKGAGIATAISNLCATVFLVIYVLAKRKTSIISFKIRRIRRAYLTEIFTTGLPSAIQIMLTCFAVGAQIKFVSKYSVEAVAALGIVKKIDQLPLYFSIGLSSGLMPLLAYNYASGNQKRRAEAFRFGAEISVGFSLLCVLLFEIFARFLVRIFIDDEQTIYYATGFLRRMVIAMPLMAICYPMIIQFQAMKKIKASLVCSILRKGALDVPLLFLLDYIKPLYGLMWVQPVVDSISLIIAIIFYRNITQSLLKK